MHCLFNDVYMRTDMAGVEFLVRLWLDASAPRPPGYYIVLPEELQPANSQYTVQSMPLGWHKVKVLYSQYKSEVAMEKCGESRDASLRPWCC